MKTSLGVTVGVGRGCGVSTGQPSWGASDGWARRSRQYRAPEPTRSPSWWKWATRSRTCRGPTPFRWASRRARVQSPSNPHKTASTSCHDAWGSATSSHRRGPSVDLGTGGGRLLLRLLTLRRTHCPGFLSECPGSVSNCPGLGGVASGELRAASGCFLASRFSRLAALNDSSPQLIRQRGDLPADRSTISISIDSR